MDEIDFTSQLLESVAPLIDSFTSVYEALNFISESLIDIKDWEPSLIESELKSLSSDHYRRDVTQHIAKRYGQASAQFTTHLMDTIQEIAQNPNKDVHSVIGETLLTPLGLSAQRHFYENSLVSALKPHRSISKVDPELDNPKKFPKIRGYKLIKLIGVGSWSHIYLATREVEGKKKPKVALKCCLHGGEFRELDEINALSEINSPFVTALHSHGKLSAGRYTHYFEIEYCHYGSLQSYISTPTPPSLKVRWIHQIILGLKAIHERQFMHRDLKPSNILISEYGVLKICDFGLAKPLDSKRTNTVEGSMIGTLPYMSPEQLEGQQVDLRSDIWSLGAIIYEIFVGKPLYYGETQTQVLRLRMSDELLIDRPEIPTQIQRVIERCVKTDPDERYQTIDECWADLQVYIEPLLIENWVTKQRAFWKKLKGTQEEIKAFCLNELDDERPDVWRRFIAEHYPQLSQSPDLPSHFLEELLSAVKGLLGERDLIMRKRESIVLKTQAEVDQIVTAHLNAKLNAASEKTLDVTETIIQNSRVYKQELESKEQLKREKRDEITAEIDALNEALDEVLETTLTRFSDPKLNWNGFLLGTEPLSQPSSPLRRRQEIVKASYELLDHSIHHKEPLPQKSFIGFSYGDVEHFEHTETLLRGHVSFKKLGNFQLSYCPPGQQRMGKRSEGSVVVKLPHGFWMMSHLVTERLWSAVMGAETRESTGSKRDGQLPITDVTWYDALKFANRLSELDSLAPYYELSESANGVEVTINPEGQGYRLPTEAEWIYAANANADPETMFAGSDELEDVAWYRDNARNGPQPVGLKRSNAWGLYDMTGNVSEWLADTWVATSTLGQGGYPLDHREHTYDPKSPKRASRGGGWTTSHDGCRITKRIARDATIPLDHLGFRLVVSCTQQEDKG